MRDNAPNDLLPRDLLKDLLQLRSDLLDATPPESQPRSDPDAARSARNLARYATLRSRDLRPLQTRLVEAGLSSLGRCEPCVLGSVDAVVRAAAALAGETPSPPWQAQAADRGTQAGRDLLERRAQELLGPQPADRSVRIMVTMPDAAADDPGFIRSCIESGMNLMRINTASGSHDQWLNMIRYLRDAEAATGQTCRVFADLPGPKLRISRIERHRTPVDRVRLHVGQRLLIARNKHHHPAKNTVSVFVSPANLLSHVSPGHAIWFDDGKVGARVDRLHDDHFEATVTFTKPGGQRIRLGKGLNLPDSEIQTPAFTADDHARLKALWGHVDAFGLSFVRSPEDIKDVRNACSALSQQSGTPQPGIVLKIETRSGFERLPDLLFELLHSSPCGVMLARGDLAVECGFERLAEIQEELLCFCEAAHVPVIWATDVLGTLAKQGRPTRAEITDAAAAQRAECVMLNKGPRILEALSTLCDILARMKHHQVKKTPMFRALGIATESRNAGARRHSRQSPAREAPTPAGDNVNDSRAASAS